MFATVINGLAILIGGSIGLILKKGISKDVSDQIMKGLGLCTIAMGINGALATENTLILILSMVIGTLIGALIDFDKRITKSMHTLENKFSKNPGETSISQGFIAASLLFCVGSMAVIGSLDAGLVNNYTMLYTKSIMDFCASIIFASTLGAGVLLSAISILVYQGSITLLASFLVPILSQSVINEMTGVGAVLIIGTGLNILGVTKIKLMNYVLAIFIPIILCQFM